MREIKEKTIIIGIIFIATIILGIGGYEYLKGDNPLKANRYFYAVFRNIGGLEETAPVTVNGVPVGEVLRIQLISQGQYVLVKFLVEDKNLQIPKGSVAEIYSSDMLGTKALRLILSKNNQFLHPGDTLLAQIQPDAFSMLASRLPVLDSILYNTAQTIAKLNQNLTPQLFDNLRQSVKILRSIAWRLDTTMAKNSRFDQSITKLNKILTELDNQMADITAIIKNTKQFTDSLNTLQLKKSLENINLAVNRLDTLLSNIKNGNGTVGQLFVNDTLYKRLDTLVGNLNAITNKFK